MHAAATAYQAALLVISESHLTYNKVVYISFGQLQYSFERFDPSRLILLIITDG